MVSYQRHTPAACAFIADHLRARDAEEITASRGPHAPAEFAADMAGAPWGFTTAWHGIPVAYVGVGETRMVRVATVGMVATDDFRHVGLQLTRACATLLPRICDRLGLTRLECRSLAGYVQAHRWLTHLGFRHEATLTRMGWAGEDFELYAWVT